MEAFKAFLSTYKLRIAGVALGIVVAVLLLCLGFFRTLLIAVLAVGGYVGGLWFESPEKCMEFIRKFLPERFR